MRNPLDIIESYITNMTNNAQESRDMGLRYDGALQVLQMLKNEFGPGGTPVEGNQDAPAGGAEDAPEVLELPAPRRRAKKVPSRG